MTPEPRDFEETAAGSPPAVVGEAAVMQFEIAFEPDLPDIELQDVVVPSDRASRPRRVLVSTLFGTALVVSLAVHAAAVGTLIWYVRHSKITPPQLLDPALTAGGMVSQPDNPMSAPSDLPPHAATPSRSIPASPPSPHILADQDDPFASAKSSQVPQSFSAPPTPVSAVADPSASAFPMPRVPAAAVNVPGPAVPPSGAKRSPVTSLPTVAAHRGDNGSVRAATNGYDDRGLAIPDYPAQCRRHHEQGLVLLKVEIHKDGTPGEIKVMQDPGYQPLVDAAIEAVRQSPFEPAKVDGVAVEGVIQIPFRFVLQK